MSPDTPVRLTRGANVALGDLVPVAGTLDIAIGWERTSSVGGPEVVPGAVVCGRDGKALSDEHFVFFNQLDSPDHQVRLSPGDAGALTVSLPDLPAVVDKVVLVVYLDPDLRRPGSFQDLRKLWFRVMDRAGTELVVYEMERGDVSSVNAVILGEVYRHQSAWKVRAVGQGFDSGLRGVATTFGISL